MRRLLLIVSVSALMLGSIAGPASASRSNAKNYYELNAMCANSGPVVVELVGLGNWTVAKVQGTNMTAIPQLFEFTATQLDGDFSVTEVNAKPNPKVDDVCVLDPFVFEVGEGDPVAPAGTYEGQATVHVKLVPRR